MDFIIEGIIEMLTESLLGSVIRNQRIPKILRLLILSLIFIPLTVLMGLCFTNADSVGKRVVFGLIALVIIMGFLALAGKVR